MWKLFRFGKAKPKVKIATCMDILPSIIGCAIIAQLLWEKKMLENRFTPRIIRKRSHLFFW